MTQEVSKAYQTIKEYEFNQMSEIATNIKDFRALMNKMISQTPTSEVREDLTHLNILFESVINNPVLIKKS